MIQDYMKVLICPVLKKHQGKHNFAIKLMFELCFKKAMFELEVSGGHWYAWSESVTGA